MSNLHVNLDEANKHDPKGFIPALNNTILVKSETGSSLYEERMLMPKAINFVDGTLPPPTNGDYDAYVLIGSGTVDAGWGNAAFGDMVRFLFSIPSQITPLQGYLCYDDTAAQWMEYDGVAWAAFGGGVGGGNLGDTNLTQSDPTRTYNLDSNELAFIDGANSIARMSPTGIVVGTSSLPASTRMLIRGAGNTVGTTALLVENSAGLDLFEIKDDGTIIGTPISNGSGTDSFETSGIGSNASGQASFALGVNAEALTTYAIAIGQDADAKTAADTIAIGRSANSTGAKSVALGTLSLASGADAVSLGQADATGQATIAMSLNALASTVYSIAIGQSSQATGPSDSTAIARSAIASGQRSVAIGTHMNASGSNCVMIGASTTAKTNATSNSMEVNFNEATSTVRLAKSADSWINTTGDFGIGTNTPAAKLHVNGDVRIDDTTATGKTISTDFLPVNVNGTIRYLALYD